MALINGHWWDVVLARSFYGRVGKQLLRDAPCAKRLLAAAEDVSDKFWDVTSWLEKMQKHGNIRISRMNLCNLTWWKEKNWLVSNWDWLVRLNVLSAYLIILRIWNCFVPDAFLPKWRSTCHLQKMSHEQADLTQELKPPPTSCSVKHLQYSTPFETGRMKSVWWFGTGFSRSSWEFHSPKTVQDYQPDLESLSI